MGTKSAPSMFSSRKLNVGKSIATVLVAGLIGCAPVSVSPDLNPTSESSVVASGDSNAAAMVAEEAAPKFYTDWPQLFGPTRNCVSSERGIKANWGESGPREIWRLPIGSGYSSPVVSRGHLVVYHRQGDEEIVQSVNPEDGIEQWRRSFPTNYRCKYEYSSGPYSTPFISDDRVFVIGAQADVRCLDLSSGELIWHRNMRNDYELEEQLFAFGASPVIDGQRLIFNLGSRKSKTGIVALDVRDGQTLWTATDHRASYASPVITQLYDRRYLFVLTYEGLVAMEPESGEVFWTEEFQSKSVDSVNATSPAVWKNHVVVMQGPGPGARCWRIQSDGKYSLAWKDRRVLDSQFNSLLVHDGHLFGFTAKREGGAAFRCVDFATGKLKWSWNSDIQRGSCVAADGRIILWGEHGHLAAVDLNCERLNASTITSEPLLKQPCYASPALSQGRLFLRNEHFLVAYDLREGP